MTVHNGQKTIYFGHYLAILLVLSLTTSLNTGCHKPQATIAFVGPLTGSSSAIGLSGRNGFLLAFGEDQDAQSGQFKESRLLVKDDRNDPDTCLAVFKELKEAGCSIIVLGTTSNTAKKAIPWAMENDVFVISPTASSIKITSPKNLFVRVNCASNIYGVKLADIAFNKYGSKKTGIIGDSRNAEYVKAVREAFIDEYARLGGSLAFSMSFDSKTDKPAATLTKTMRETQSDGVVIVAASTDVVLMEKELERDGQKAQVFLPPWPLTLDLLQNGGSAVEGAIALSIADLEFRNPPGKAFETAYRAEFGEAPSFTAMFGYEAASILRTALEKEPSANPEKIHRRIIDIGEFKGLQGTISFNSRAEAERDIFMFVVKNGAFQRIE